jgi:hypothetical protein
MSQENVEIVPTEARTSKVGRTRALDRSANGLCDLLAYLAVTGLGPFDAFTAKR